MLNCSSFGSLGYILQDPIHIGQLNIIQMVHGSESDIQI